MKPKATRRKRVRKTKSARKSVSIRVAGKVTSFFKGKSSFLQIRLNRLWAAFGKPAK